MGNRVHRCRSLGIAPLVAGYRLGRDRWSGLPSSGWQYQRIDGDQAVGVRTARLSAVPGAKWSVVLSAADDPLLVQMLSELRASARSVRTGRSQFSFDSRGLCVWMMATTFATSSFAAKTPLMSSKTLFEATLFEATIAKAKCRPFFVSM